jgi:thiamine monophosphate kinase
LARVEGVVLLSGVEVTLATGTSLVSGIQNSLHTYLFNVIKGDLNNSDYIVSE